MATMEEKDAIIQKKLQEVRDRIEDAKYTIRSNERTIDSLLVWRPTPKQQEEIRQLDEISDREQEYIDANEPILERLEELTKALEEAKARFKEYKDIFEYLELEEAVDKIRTEMEEEVKKFTK